MVLFYLFCKTVFTSFTLPKNFFKEKEKFPNYLRLELFLRLPDKPQVLEFNSLISYLHSPTLFDRLSVGGRVFLPQCDWVKIYLCDTH